MELKSSEKNTNSSCEIKSFPVSEQCHNIILLSCYGLIHENQLLCQQYFTKLIYQNDVSLRLASTYKILVTINRMWECRADLCRKKNIFERKILGGLWKASKI